MVIVGSEKREWRFGTEYDYGGAGKYAAVEEVGSIKLNANFNKQFIKSSKSWACNGISSINSKLNEKNERDKGLNSWETCTSGKKALLYDGNNLRIVLFLRIFYVGTLAYSLTIIKIYLIEKSHEF